MQTQSCARFELTAKLWQHLLSWSHSIGSQWLKSNWTWHCSPLYCPGFFFFLESSPWWALGVRKAFSARGWYIGWYERSLGLCWWSCLIVAELYLLLFSVRPVNKYFGSSWHFPPLSSLSWEASSLQPLCQYQNQITSSWTVLNRLNCFLIFSASKSSHQMLQSEITVVLN